jgi:phage shock protein A
MTLMQRLEAWIERDEPLFRPKPSEERVDSIDGHLATMSRALERKERELGNLEKELHRVQSERQSAEAHAESYDEAAQAAVVDGSDELARAALSRYLSGRREASRHREREALLVARRENLLSSLEDRKDRLERIRRRLQEQRRARSEKASTDGAPVSEDVLKEERIAEEDVELELLRRKNGARRAMDPSSHEPFEDPPTDPAISNTARAEVSDDYGEFSRDAVPEEVPHGS